MKKIDKIWDKTWEPMLKILLGVLIVVVSVSLFQYMFLDSGYSQPPEGAWQGCTGNSGNSGYTHDGTLVFDGTGPGLTWTDLDLSSYVGAEYKLVLLKIGGVGSNTAGAFRPDGDTDDYYLATPYASVNRFWVTSANEAMAMLETGSNGIIEWKTTSAAACKIWLLGYM